MTVPQNQEERTLQWVGMILEKAYEEKIKVQAGVHETPSTRWVAELVFLHGSFRSWDTQ